MPKVEFKRVQTDAEVENIDIKDGQLIYTGTGKTYMDYGSERIPTGSGGSSVEVDTEMSDTSENAVQNKVIKEYVDDQVSSIPEEVIVSDTQPTSDDWKLWIDRDKQTDNTYYNDNGTPTNIKTTTFDTLPVGAEVDYDGNTVPTGWTEVQDYDTGWVDLSSYVNTSNFTIRSGYKPMARRIGNMVFWRGSVYCSSAMTATRANLLTNIPSQFLPVDEEASGGGVHYGLGTPYKIYITTSGDLTISQGSNIPTTSDYQGYSLSDVGVYLVD